MTTRPIPRRALASVALVLAAAGIALQGRFNGALTAQTHNPLEVGILNVIVGLVLGGLVLVGTSHGRTGVRAMVHATRSGELPWWAFLGGVAGITLVTMQSGVVAVLGVAAFSVALVAGQTSSGAVMDRFGFATGYRIRITGQRLGAIALALLAVVVTAFDRAGGTDVPQALVWVLLGLSVIGGGISSLQVTVNGRVARAARTPLVAAWVSFAVSLLVGGPLLALLSGVGVVTLVPIPTDHPWLLLGGGLGLLYVMAASWAVSSVGLLLTAILTVVGSLGGGLLIDLVAPTAGAPAGWQLVIGVFLAGLAAAFAARGRNAATPRVSDSAA